MKPDLRIIVGASGSSHLGSSLLRAADRLGMEAELCDAKSAWNCEIQFESVASASSRTLRRMQT